MNFEETLAATLLPMLRDTVRSELRAALAEARPQEPSEYINVASAARIADVDPKTMRAWMKAGRLPQHHAGRELRVRRDELERFLRAGPHADERDLSAEATAEAILGRK